MLEPRMLRLSYRCNLGDHGERERSGLSPEGPGQYQEPRPLPAVLLASRGGPPATTERRGDVWFPLPPHRCPQSQSDPAGQVHQLIGFSQKPK